MGRLCVVLGAGFWVEGTGCKWVVVGKARGALRLWVWGREVLLGAGAETSWGTVGARWVGAAQSRGSLTSRVPCPTTPLVRTFCWRELSHILWCSEGTILAMHSGAIRGGALGSLWDARDRTPAFHYQAKTPCPMLSLLVPELGFLVSGTAASKHMTVFRAAWGVGHPLGGLPGYLGASARRQRRETPPELQVEPFSISWSGRGN